MKNDRVPFGLVQGRFQMIHWGHMEYFLEAKKRSETLIIGISDPDPTRSFFQFKLDDDDTRKPFRKISNPFHTFTYFERMMMIREALIEAKIPRETFEIVPFPVHFPKLLKYYIPMNAKVFVTIYENWGREKLEIFEDLGFETEILWERNLSERFTTGAEVRRRISKNEPWEELVPPSVARVIKSLELPKTLQELGEPSLNG